MLQFGRGKNLLYDMLAKKKKQFPNFIFDIRACLASVQKSSVKKTTHPRSYDLYDIFCAVLYLMKAGCSWRAIPHDFPKWQNVRYHYDIWAEEDEDGISLLDRVLRKLVELEREKNLQVQ